MTDPKRNGVLHFDEDEGKMQVQFGNAPAFEIDAMAVMNEWYAKDQSFRDDKGEVPKAHFADYQLAPWQFVRTLMDRIMPGLETNEQRKQMKEAADKLSLSNANKFLHLVHQETKRLRHFFEESSTAGPSLPESSAEEVVFST
jgi:hypothetical protein